MANCPSGGNTAILRDKQNSGQAFSAFRTLHGAQKTGKIVVSGPTEEKMNLGNEIRKRRKALGMTLEELALQVDGNNGNLSRLERGLQGYSDEMIRKIAKALGCSVADLFASSVNEANVVPVPIGSRRIPLINYVQAGHMREVVDQGWIGDAAEFLLTDLELSAGSFALSVKGDSMLPDFREGDRVIIDPAVQPQPGDFVVAKNGGEEATFKKYRPRGLNERGDEVFELIPLNDDYPPMRSDMTPLLIIGTMVEHRRYRKR